MFAEFFRILLPYMQWLGLLSMVTFILSLLIIPLIIGRLPEDFFLTLREKIPVNGLNPIGIALFALSNVLGAILITAGILMLFLPGQGILTMLVGLICMSFPGKQVLVNRLTRNTSLQKSLDWVRRKMAKPPFLWQ